MYCIVIGTVDIVDAIPIKETLEGDKHILEQMYDSFEEANRVALQLREDIIEKTVNYLRRAEMDTEDF